MPIEWNVTVLAALGVGLLVGVWLGVLLRSRSGAADRARAEQLDGELEQTREDLDAHRDDVARHFQETSDLFRDVTEQYSRLYTHLATGAKTFSTEAVPALAPLETPLLAHAEEGLAEASSSDLEVEAETAAPESESLAATEPEAAAPDETDGNAAAQQSAAAGARVEPLPSVKANGGLGAPGPPPPAA